MGNLRTTTRELADDQLAAFDTEYVTPFLWESVEHRLRADFPSGRLRFVDLGGGNGVFADRLLAAFPEASGVVVDRSGMLLERNVPHARKRLVQGGIEDVVTILAGERFDVVFLNWVLHHLVTGTWSGSGAMQARALSDASTLLTADGRISIMENFYDGAMMDALPGRLIFAATASRALAPLTRRLGANTAGVGVAFRSKRDWLQVIAANGLEAGGVTEDFVWRTSPAKRIAFHIGSVRAGHLWCRPTTEGAKRA